MDPTAYVNCDIYTGDGVLANHALVVKEGIIDLIIPTAELQEDISRVDLRGLSVAPGFIDIQVNGGGDVLFNENTSVEGLRAMVSAHRRYGVTSILPTFITGSLEGMRAAAGAVAEYRRLGESGVAGIHFEGPAINVSKAGVHDPDYIVGALGDEVLDIYTGSNVGKVLVTLAPEVLPDMRAIEMLHRRGALVACGHTEADAPILATARVSGVSLGTHVFNAMKAMSARDPGSVGAVLADDRMYASFIADGFHVDFQVLKVAVSAKPSGKAFLVTDAMPPVGGDKAGYTLGPYVVSVTDEGKCVTADGVLAGSALDMATAIRNMIQKVGLPKDEALRMGSTYPAAFLGIAESVGYLRAGYRADLAIFDNEIHVQTVVVGGEVVKLT